jgi:hypothetical protein
MTEVTGAFRRYESELKNTELLNVIYWVHRASIMSKVIDLTARLP